MAERKGQQMSPEEVRRKWDELLAVINNVATTAGDVPDVSAPASPSGSGGHRQRGQLKAARDLMESSQPSPKREKMSALDDQHSPEFSGEKLQRGAASTGNLSPKRGQGRPQWDDRHHLLYSTVNDKMQKNVRSYFDRPRDIDAHGQRYDHPLRTTWQLNTPMDAPPPGAAMELSPMSTANFDKLLKLSRSYSAPKLTHSEQKEKRWNARHHVCFAKDNHYFQANLREYFERPRHLHV
ncbi:unnamed protein product [Symbiodinium natans]|uniref:Uncharacterized protein n=1 Tax=Symbiodinium natans TaxID=878477 RepID=A0A812P8H1_9DINO|nr:unnamed protein product [Symbiodinium natans]